MTGSLNLNYTESSPEFEPGDIRLKWEIDQNGAGRVQICDDREWKEVCAPGWDKSEARVACRQLGFSDKGMILFL